MIYDKFAKNYDKVFAPFERYFLSNWRRETLAHLPENSLILEVGAGTGANFRFYPSCKKAVAGEISFKMIEIAKGKTDFIELVQADAEICRLPQILLMRHLQHWFFARFQSRKMLFANCVELLNQTAKSFCSNTFVRVDCSDIFLIF